ncbi:MAG: hypothetical protein GY841_22540, partial [FCB group bacterium]|nr:hypothetical protein [FCB group bacterium]
MRKIICTLVLTSLIFSSVTAQDTPDSTTIDTDSLLNFGMEMILDKMLLTRDDFTFRDDYTPKDPYRLKIVDSLMTHPILMADFTENFAEVMRGFDTYPENVTSTINSLFGDIQFPVPDDPNVTRISSPAKFGGEGGEFITKFMKATFSAGIQDEIFYDIPDELIEFIKHEFQELILDDPDYRKWSNEQLDSIQNVEEEWAKNFASMAVNFQAAQTNGLALYQLEKFIKDNRAIMTPDYIEKVYTVWNSLPAHANARIALGNPGNDIYTGEYSIIIDLGGDDVYNLSYDINSPNTCIIIDCEGDDYYNAMTDFALACGALSFSLLIDYEGDDIYQAKNFGLGAGYFGVGILWDKKGNDKYFGDTFVQGAGTFGYGLLIDEEGSDVYTANLQSQGFGFVNGIGGIADYDGNDSYIIQPKYKEYFHEGNHYTSLSQGFSIGVRPHMSGGFGFICDYGGNDSYLADFFAQASSYWWSLGMIYDRAGNDLYSTYQYAQGAGAHMTLGMLMDCAGDDVYRSHGVCQGCGHDYSCGWLLDKGGHDVYTSQGLAQGAGQANG